MVRSSLLAVVGALLFAAAFPPTGWVVLSLVAPVGLMLAAVLAPTWRAAALSGAVFGVVFMGVLMGWISNLGEEAISGLLASQAPFYGAYAVLLWGFRTKPTWELAVVSVGGWAVLELIRERVPFGGLNWGAIGYPLGEWVWTRGAAQWIGTSGLGVVAAGCSAGLMVFVVRRGVRWAGGAIGVLAVLAGLGAWGTAAPAGHLVRVALVQGNSPCPLEHCENERERIFENHLRLTQQLAPGSVDLVVWPESATSFSVNPVSPSEGQLRVAAEAERLGATLLVGGDRPGTPSTFINSNAVFAPDGLLVGEYLKNHPVPFGEYVPLRPIFGLIPETARVPRDMVRGDGPVVFTAQFGTFGSVISYEGAFARYGRDVIAAGAQLLIVASNEASFGVSSASDQFIAMTRMRAAENGVDVIHGAVTGSSVFITEGGRLGPPSGLFVEAVLLGEVRLRDEGPTLYTAWGDWVSGAAATLLAVALMWRWIQDLAWQAALRSGGFSQDLTGPKK